MTQVNSIVIYPHSQLRKKARIVSVEEIISDKMKMITKNMIDLMYRAKGVGLAAPQVDLPYRLTVIDAGDGYGPRVLFNPVIISKSHRTAVAEEGCLSLPMVFGDVKRFRTVTVEYYDTEGKKQTIKAPVFLSRVLQHEIDHLDGILFIDKLEGEIKSGKELLDSWNQNKKPLLDITYPYRYE